MVYRETAFAPTIHRGHVLRHVVKIVISSVRKFLGLLESIDMEACMFLLRPMMWVQVMEVPPRVMLIGRPY